jgi:hypothetical protein
MVIELEGKNEPISFTHTALGNCFLEADHGCLYNITIFTPKKKNLNSFIALRLKKMTVI